MSPLRKRSTTTCLILTGDLAAPPSLSHEIHTASPANLHFWRGRGKVLFTEGEPARGVYILLTGRAAVSISSSGGKTIILRVAQAGDVLGLNSTLRNGTYDETVQTLEPCHTDFISRTELIALMDRSQQCTHAVLRELSQELTELGDRTKTLLLSQSSSVRLAKLLLEWSSKSIANRSSIGRIDKSYTQEEMARMIGSSRETVTRLLATLTRRHIIEITPDSILIRDWDALETAAEDE